MTNYNKYLLSILFFLIPFHALLVTFFQCKIWINVDFIRFWKEIILIILLFTSVFWVFKKYDFSLKKIYKNNDLLWFTTAFIICSFIYIYFPFFKSISAWYLGFKYDVFFFFALIAWLYLNDFKENINFYLKILFISVWLNLVIFLPVYVFWDVPSFYSLFWYSDKVSTYTAWKCIAFAQNTPWSVWNSWINRFQWSFSWPITLSVFLTVFYIIYVWYILTFIKNTRKRLHLILIPWIFVISSIYFSYSKTSILWALFWAVLFGYLIRKIIFKKKISKKFIINSSFWIIASIIFVIIIKRDLFLHLDAIINRFENLTKSVEMFFYNPIWYGLWVAWPASQIWRSLESAWKDWEIWLSSITTTHRFLPENWYVQILLEQWIFWVTLFIAVLVIIWVQLYKIAKHKKDYLSISIFVAFITLCFMANFTHAFEESATSYLLFIIIWWYISTNSLDKEKIKY